MFHPKYTSDSLMHTLPTSEDPDEMLHKSGSSLFARTKTVKLNF